jgi:hypothetical protein
MMVSFRKRPRVVSCFLAASRSLSKQLQRAVTGRRERGARRGR